MKKLLFLLVLSIAFIVASCSDEPTIEKQFQDPKLDSNLQSLNVVFNRLDSLNTEYSSHISRGPITNWLYIQFADEVGQICGNYLGRWAGTAIGSSVAGPAGACIGYVGGWKVGGKLGYWGASAVASKYFSCAGLAMIWDPKTMGNNYNNGIKVSGMLRDYNEYVLQQLSVEEPNEGDDNQKSNDLG